MSVELNTEAFKKKNRREHKINKAKITNRSQKIMY